MKSKSSSRLVWRLLVLVVVGSVQLVMTSCSGGSAASAVVPATVYTAGYYDNGTMHVPCYWTGTARTDLGDGTHEAVAKTIFIK